jgi:hypothetical protein
MTRASGSKDPSRHAPLPPSSGAFQAAGGNHGPPSGPPAAPAEAISLADLTKMMAVVEDAVGLYNTLEVELISFKLTPPTWINAWSKLGDSLAEMLGKS